MPGKALAQVLQEWLDSNRKIPSALSLQNHKIDRIGQVSQQIALQISALNLKNNQLKSLQGLELFKSLQILDLSQNRISSDASILTLKGIKNLKKLFLKGNPFLQKPLNQQIIVFLNCFENDLQILNFAFVNQPRQAMIKQFKKNKSQNKFVEIPPTKTQKIQQPSDNYSKNIQISKHVQQTKASMLLSSMKQFIEEQQQSQQISSQSINVESLLHESIIVKKQQHQVPLRKISEVTPLRKIPRFSSYTAEGKTTKEDNQTLKFEEESTDFKYRNLKKLKIQGCQSACQSNYQTGSKKCQKLTAQKSGKRQSPRKTLRRPKENQASYQVQNLNIRLEMDSGALNYPSIIEKQDHDSYEIEFDFMSSPSRQTASKRNNISQNVSPSNQLKELTASYVKIEIDQQFPARQDQDRIKKSPEPQIKSPTGQKAKAKQFSNTFAEFKRAKQYPSHSWVNPKTKQKQNHFQNRQRKREEPSVSKRGSLHESTRHLIPETNKSTAYDLIAKLLPNRHLRTQSDSLSFALNNSLSEMIESGQKFERFYYNSLTRLRPVFNLLYSPFSSLKPDEKDMLLQELFKNHKQIFILFIREFHSRQKLQDEIQLKNHQIQELSDQIKYMRGEFYDYDTKYKELEQNFGTVSAQNNKLAKEALQFGDILASRQKIIQDIQIQYEKANKLISRKQHQIQRFLNQDQIQEQIQNIHEIALKRQLLQLIKKKANTVYKIHSFQKRRKQNHSQHKLKREKQFKRLAFGALLKNFQKHKILKTNAALKNQKILMAIFQEWKLQAHLSRTSNHLQVQVNNTHKRQAIQFLRSYALRKKRNPKILNLMKIKLKRKCLLRGFKKNKDQQKVKTIQSLEKAQYFYSINLIKCYFVRFKTVKILLERQMSEKQNKVETLVIKRQLGLFKRLIKALDRQQQFKVNYIKEVLIKKIESKVFLSIMNTHFDHKTSLTNRLNLALNFRTQKLFKTFELTIKKNVRTYQKVKHLVYKTAHEHKLKILVTKFKQNRISEKIGKQHKQQLFLAFKDFHQTKLNYIEKQTQLVKFLSFRRGFKAKTNFISVLRHMNVLKKMKNKEANLSEHYHMQESKYRQGHELNMFTMEQFKAEINSYLNEIQFYKLQVQKLSQRQLFILQEKQKCLIQIQCKEEENLELKTILIQSQKKLQELQKKYQKSLDMYAAAIQNAQKQQSRLFQKLQKGKKTFLYDTISGPRSPTTFRKEPNESPFSSLKR